MHRRKLNLLLGSALASCVLLTAARAPADSLVTTDGDMMVGPITKTDDGYTIVTPDGPVLLPFDKVKRVLYDHPPAAAPAVSSTALVRPASVKPGFPGSAEVPVARKTLDPRTVNKLIEQGENAMAAAEFGDARDAFKDALSVDAKNALAGRGLGFAYVALGKPSKAVAPLEIAALNPPLDRSLVLALASSLVSNHNVMRAVKFLCAYLEAHSQPLDEPMINALAIALSQADSSATKSSLYQESAKLYAKLNSALEATRQGQKRWGLDWLSADEVATKKSARLRVQPRVDAAAAKLQTANNEVQVAQLELNQLERVLIRMPDFRIRQAQNRLDQATLRQEKAQTDYDAVNQELAEVPSPTYPPEIIVENSDLVMPVALAEAKPATPAPVAVVPRKPDDVVASAAPAPRVKPDIVDPVKPDVAAVAPAASAPAPETTAADPTPPASKHLTRYAVGFAIAPDVLVTSAAVVEDATTITIETADGQSMPATVLRSAHGDGLSLLKVDGAHFRCLSLASAPAAGALSCFSYPEVDLFNPAAKSLSVTADAGTDAWTVRFDIPPRLPGGPLLQHGQVVGVELGERDSEPAAVPAATLKAVTSLVADSANPSTLTTDPKQAVVQVIAER